MYVTMTTTTTTTKSSSPTVQPTGGPNNSNNVRIGALRTSHDRFDSARAQSCLDDSSGFDRPSAIKIGTHPSSIMTLRDEEFDEMLHKPVAHEICGRPQPVEAVSTARSHSTLRLERHTKAHYPIPTPRPHDQRSQPKGNVPQRRMLTYTHTTMAS